MNLLSLSRSFSARCSYRNLKPARIATLCTAFLLLGAADASAAIRYAAPAGNEAAGSECLQANPCSLFNAADRLAPNTKLAAGDEIVVEPGNYSDTAGDLGPGEVIDPKLNTTIHGLAGQPRPLITVHGNIGTGVFFIRESGVGLGRLEIISTEERRAFDLLAPGTVDGLIARTSSHLPVCEARAGVLRDSACLSSGAFGSALGISGGAVKLRNDTAIATGRGSHGLEAMASGNVEVSVDALGLLARGDAADIFAKASSPMPPTGAGAKVTLNLEHSDFASSEPKSENGGIVSITAPGTSDNITAEPLLGADGYHELLGSPTIDKGAADPSSGTTDIDGEQRVFGPAADIGADELQLATTTALSCNPASLSVGGSATCTATVSSAAGSPSGVVKLTSDGPGSFAGGASCALAPAGQGKASCKLPYTPSAIGPGPHELTASYQGDAAHSASQGSTTLRILSAHAGAPNTTLKKKPARRTANRQASFTFVSNQPGSHFQCKLDKAPFKPCRSPYKHKAKPGRHRFAVRAVSPGGAADPTPARFSWRVSSR